MLEIKPVNSKRELKRFIKFSIELYNGNQYAVPPLIADDLNTLSKETNPAFDFCEAQYFLCYRQGKPVGRIAAIINHRSNEIWQKKHGRFGFIDFVEDFEVAKALIQAAEEWLAARGMTAIEGPLGFTDFDREGMLVEGFDQLGTMATLYNHSYYPRYMERMGFVKEADWIECKIYTPKEIPERIANVAKIVCERTGINIIRVKSNRQIIEQGWGDDLFKLTNLSFASLFGYSELSQKQIDTYVKQYLPMVRLEYLTLITDSNNKLIAYGMGLPSLSRALQKARGKLFPTGFFHLYRALKAKKHPIIDFMLIAIHPQWQGRGVNAVIMEEFLREMIKAGVVYAESNPELEVNTQIGDQWSKNFNVEYHKRRRAYIRKIER